MCLTCITKQPPTLPAPPQFGYKIFILVQDNYKGMFRHTHKELYKEEVWYDADTTRILHDTWYGTPYYSGFHVYLTEDGARARIGEEMRVCNIAVNRMVIRKVEVQEIKTWGYEHKEFVFVAERMKICA